MTRTEFWAMQPDELWWLFEAKRRERMVGSLSEDDARSLYETAVAGGVEFKRGADGASA